MPFLILLAATLIAAIIHTLVMGAPALHTFLFYFLVIQYGAGGLFFGYFHIFKPDFAAERIGWPAGNPFQREVGFADASFGVAGILCIWFADGFRLAVAIITSLFLLGAAAGHIVEIMREGNRSPDNAGFGLLVMNDIAVPLFVLTAACVDYFA